MVALWHFWRNILRRLFISRGYHGLSSPSPSPSSVSFRHRWRRFRRRRLPLFFVVAVFLLSSSPSSSFRRRRLPPFVVAVFHLPRCLPLIILLLSPPQKEGTMGSIVTRMINLLENQRETLIAKGLNAVGCQILIVRENCFA